MELSRRQFLQAAAALAVLGEWHRPSWANAPVWVPPATRELRSIQNVWIRLRDGTRLAARVFLPQDMPEGAYELRLRIVDRQKREPRVRLAIEGRTPDGWYKVGPITVEEGPYPVTTERDLDTP